VPDKNHLITSILEINPSATTEWLAEFSEADLREYLDHLMVTIEPAALARWVRNNTRAPMVTRDAA
jgi:hypothetical protein